MTIDRCLCYDQTFAALKEIAEREDACSVAVLQEHAAFGQNCALCHPYVRRMLRTGETVFDEIIREEDEPAAEECG